MFKRGPSLSVGWRLVGVAGCVCVLWFLKPLPDPKPILDKRLGVRTATRCSAPGSQGVDSRMQGLGPFHITLKTSKREVTARIHDFGYTRLEPPCHYRSLQFRGYFGLIPPPPLPQGLPRPLSDLPVQFLLGFMLPIRGPGERADMGFRRAFLQICAPPREGPKARCSTPQPARWTHCLTAAGGCLFSEQGRKAYNVRLHMTRPENLRSKTDISEMTLCKLRYHLNWWRSGLGIESTVPHSRPHSVHSGPELHCKRPQAQEPQHPTVPSGVQAAQAANALLSRGHGDIVVDNLRSSATWV